MTGRGPLDAQPGFSLPVFDRLAPAPPPGDRRRADRRTTPGPGDVVADLFGRGGWVARAAIDRQRRAVSLESSPLTRMLAEVVLRPPDVRHLDAAFQGMAASPRRESSLKVSIGDMFATRCATCGRTLVVDEIVWSVDDEAGIAGRTRPVARHYRCTVCRDQRGGSEQRQAPLDADDLRARHGRRRRRGDADQPSLARFPVVDGRREPARRAARPPHAAASWSASGRSSSGSRATCAPRPVLAALRLALLHAILPASRLATQPGRTRALRVSSGHVRPQSGTQFRERNPWLAFEDGVPRRPRLHPAPRRRDDRARSRRGSARTCAASARARPRPCLGLDRSGRSRRRCADDPNAYGRTAATPRVRLVLGQPPMRPSLERLAAAYHATSWVLGREAASLLPIDGLAGALAARPVELAGGRPSAARSRPSSRRWRATAGSSSSSTAVPRRSSRRCSAGRRPATGCSARGWPTPTRTPPPIVELLPPGGAPAAGAADPRQRRPRPAAGRRRRPGPRPGDPACSRRRSGSTSGRSRPPTPRAP